jgi:hypothetical protein
MGAGDVADLRVWLRGLLAVSGSKRPRPSWLDEVMPGLTAGHLRALIARALAELTTTGVLREQEADAWADYARLTGQRGSQKEMARRLGVTTRTARAWLTKGDAALASYLASWSPTASHDVSGDRDDVSLAAALAELEIRLRAEKAPIERLEAVQAFAADRLGGKHRPRRHGADRSRRKREYDRVPERLELLGLQPLPPERLEAESILPVPYPLADDPEGAVEALHRSWLNRDRHLTPILADHALRLTAGRVAEQPELRLAVLEVVTNALRDAESLGGFTFTRTWAQVTAQVYGPSDFRAWKARGVLIHLMQIHGYHQAALRAQRRHVATFSHVRYGDEEDYATHRMDRLARLVSLELDVGGADCVERMSRTVSVMRDLEDSGGAVPAQASHILTRRRLETELARAVHHASGRRPIRSTRLERLAEELEGQLPALATDRLLGALDLLVSVDIAYRDWPSLRRHAETLHESVRPGAAANLVHRINYRLRHTHRLGGPEIPQAPPPFDPLRLPDLLPRSIYVPTAWF